MIASPDEYVGRIRSALNIAFAMARQFDSRHLRVTYKFSGDPVTEADTKLNNVLRECLVQRGEAWLSEESKDDSRRLANKVLWVVDALDGTREFVAGIPEWCISVALVIDHVAVAGGVCNPVKGEFILGAAGRGITYNDSRACTTLRAEMRGARVLASRSEFNRGDWDRHSKATFTVQPVGSIAYKLALVACGRADATWTLTPKHEWDVAAGIALVQAGGGSVWTTAGTSPVLNKPTPKLAGLLASGSLLRSEIDALLGIGGRPRLANAHKVGIAQRKLINRV